MKRFWDKVTILSENECWEWTAGIRSVKTGYGAFKFKGKVVDAHRMSWFLTYKRFPPKLLLHHCDNRKCVNPKHLFEGTYIDNVLDMLKKGRQGIHPTTGKILTTHGKKTMYSKHKCRCNKCKEAYSIYQKRYR